MSTLQYDNPLVENYLAQFEHLSLEEQKIVFAALSQKQSIGEAAMFDDDEYPDPARMLPNGKTAIDDFLDFCMELNIPPMTDEEIEQARFEALMEKYG